MLTTVKFDLNMYPLTSHLRRAAQGVQHRWVDENAPVRPAPIRDGLSPPPAGAPAHAPIKAAALAAGAAGPARAAAAARLAPGEPDARRAAQNVGSRERAAKVRRSSAADCLFVCQGWGLCRLVPRSSRPASACHERVRSHGTHAQMCGSRRMAGTSPMLDPSRWATQDEEEHCLAAPGGSGSALGGRGPGAGAEVRRSPHRFMSWVSAPLPGAPYCM